MDFVSKEKRSKIMRGVKQKDTKPELAVRSLLHQMGYRFRLHRRDLPGSPDIVLPRYKVALFVHGCFWHQHVGCPEGRRPTSNTVFWNKKFDANAARDRRSSTELRRDHWKVATVWECQTRNTASLIKAIRAFLPAHRATARSRSTQNP
jgi:DNA mismatch endonuclease (patch repair protein)